MCHNRYMAKSREEYNTYMREYMLRRYHERRRRAVEHLGGACRVCQSVEDLEIDHINKADKTIPLNKLWSIAEDRFWKEIEKCQILCKPCHEEKSIKDMGRKRAKGKHGTVSSYRYCKCKECKAAKQKSNKENNMRRKQKPSS